MNKLQAVDVICQFSRDGTVIPMRVRICDEEGEYQAYTIKGYRDISPSEPTTFPNGLFIGRDTKVFLCNITVFGRNRPIKLYFTDSDSIWRMDY